MGRLRDMRDESWVPVLSVLLLVGASLTACQRQESSGQGEIEIVDVAPGRTSALTTAFDETAPTRSEAFSGVLPQDFPPDLPLYNPSNLTDFGDAGGGRYVLLFTPDTVTVVRDRLVAQLAGSGWARIDGDAVRGTYRRGSQSVILDVQDANPGTEIRVEY